MEGFAAAAGVLGIWVYHFEAFSVESVVEVDGSAF